MTKRVTQLVLGAGAALSVAFMAWAGEPTSGAWWAKVLPFAAWVLLPYAIIEAAVLSARRTRAVLPVLFVGAALLTASSLVALTHALILDVRDQSGLVFLGLPMWQAPGAVLCGVVALVLGQRRSSA